MVVRIAVIGAGAAGTSAAWQIRERFGDNADITVFEKKEHAGGRAWTVDFAGTTVEIGGSILHSTGHYTREWQNIVGAHEGQSGLSIDGKDETYAFWNRDGFVVNARTSLAALGWSIVRHVGIRSTLILVQQAKHNASKWTKIYDLQREGQVFETPEQIISALGLKDSTSKSLGQALRDAGANEKLIKDIAEPIIHNMYNQGEDIEAFAGEVGLAGAGLAGGYLYCIDGGNWSLLHRLLESLHVRTRYGSTVTAIRSNDVQDEHHQHTGKAVFDVSFQDNAGHANTEKFDVVVLAAPLALAGITLEHNGEKLPVDAHPYQRVETTLVVGRLRREYFHATGKRLPSTVFIADSAPSDVKSIGVTGYSPKYHERMYKIFSAEHVVNDDELNRIFDKVQDVLRFTWEGAYPILRPNTQHVPFTLAPGLFYANAFETVAGSIEVEAVGGWNTGHLAIKYIEHISQ